MNKSQFITHISEQNNCTKVEAEKTIDMFTSSVIGVLGDGEEVSLVGFGNFSVSDVKARPGRNPRTGETMKIPAKKVVKFKAGADLK